MRFSPGVHCEPSLEPSPPRLNTFYPTRPHRFPRLTQHCRARGPGPASAASTFQLTRPPAFTLLWAHCTAQSSGASCGPNAALQACTSLPHHLVFHISLVLLLEITPILQFRSSPSMAVLDSTTKEGGRETHSGNLSHHPPTW